MQKFAPLEDLTRQGDCPSAEDLAAYIDGLLPEDEAARITEHLASCEECYEVYAGTVRFQLDSEPKPAGQVVPFPTDRWKPAVVWTSIAAVLVAGVGLGGYQLLASPPAMRTADVAASIPVQPRVVEEIWTGPVNRGGSGEDEGEDEEDVPLDEATFQTGVQLVNLQVCLKAGKVEAAQNASVAIFNLLEDLFAEELRQEYGNLTSTLNDRQKAPSDFLPLASLLAAKTRAIFPGDEHILDLGQWVEAGRLAAIAREPAFFERRDTRAFLRRLLWREKFGLGETRLDPETHKHLQEISRILDSDDLQERDYAGLVSRFDKILEAKYPQ